MKRAMVLDERIPKTRCDHICPGLYGSFSREWLYYFTKGDAGYYNLLVVLPTGKHLSVYLWSKAMYGSDV